MKMQLSPLSLGLLAATLLAGAAAAAPWGPPGYSTFDRNGDGWVSEEEFQAMRAERMAERAAMGYPMRGARYAPTFSEFDKNGDGNLTPEEIRDGIAAQRAKMTEQRGRRGGYCRFGDCQPEGAPPAPAAEAAEKPATPAAEAPASAAPRGPKRGPGRIGMGRPGFETFDQNGDGRISREEFDATRAARHAAMTERGFSMPPLAPPPFGFDRPGDAGPAPEDFPPMMGTPGWGPPASYGPYSGFPGYRGYPGRW